MTDNSGSKATDRGALWRYQRMRRLVLFISILVLGTGLLFVSSAWGDGLMHEAIEIGGLGLIMVGIVGRIWSTLYIGGRKAMGVVTEGPYSVMRNPLYFFSAIAAAGAGAQSGSLILAVAAFIFTVLAFHIVIFREEAFLSGTFGAPYNDYVGQVPRFFPNVALFKDPEMVEVSTRSVYSTFFDGLVFFISLPLLEFIESAQKAGYLPVLAQLY